MFWIDDVLTRSISPYRIFHLFFFLSNNPDRYSHKFYILLYHRQVFLFNIFNFNIFIIIIPLLIILFLKLFRYLFYCPLNDNIYSSTFSTVSLGFVILSILFPVIDDIIVGFTVNLYSWYNILFTSFICLLLSFLNEYL